MISLLPPLIAGSPLLFGAIATLVFGRRPAHAAIPGLLFHTVVPKPQLEMSHFPLRLFETFCRELAARSYTGICVKDAFSAQQSVSAGKRLLITFDDGLRCVFEHALPVLGELSIKSTVFCLGSNFGASSTWDIYTRNIHLSKSEIREISANGHEIGSHTMTHPCLTYLDDRSVKNELELSRKALEDITGKEVTSCAFPYGGWNRRIWSIARETGYTAATLYRGKPVINEALFPVRGVYRYESVADIFDKIELPCPFTPAFARSIMMSHFARGTPLWKYRREYVKV